MQIDIKEKLKKYADSNEKISSMFFIDKINSSKQTFEVYTLVEDVIISKMQEELEEIFDDIILINKRKGYFKVDKKTQQYTKFEIYMKDSSKLIENIVSEDLALDFIQNLNRKLNFIYDKNALEEKITQEDVEYKRARDFEFENCIRNFYAEALDISFYLLERNNISALVKMEKLRSELLNMVNWHLIEKFSRKKDMGDNGENLKYTLEAEDYEILEETFSCAKIEEIYKSLFKACQLFRKLGLDLSEKLSYPYLKKEDVDSMKILRHNYKKIESILL